MKTRSLSMYLHHWCKANGFDVTIRYGEDFACGVADSIIQYSFITDQEQDEMLSQVFADEGLDYTCDIFILSFFHELGHYMTDHNWTDEQSCDFMKRKSCLNGAIKADNFTYFYMPDEIMATRWAVDYINANANIVEDFWYDVKARIMKVYEDMGYQVQ